MTMATAAFVWKGVALVGSFWLFWCAYFTTLAVGIGEGPSGARVHACMWGMGAPHWKLGHMD